MKDFPVSGRLLKLYSFSPSIFSLSLEDCYQAYDEIFNEEEEKVESEQKKGGSFLPPDFYFKNSIS